MLIKNGKCVCGARACEYLCIWPCVLAPHLPSSPLPSCLNPLKAEYSEINKPAAAAIKYAVSNVARVQHCLLKRCSCITREVRKEKLTERERGRQDWSLSGLISPVDLLMSPLSKGEEEGGRAWGAAGAESAWNWMTDTETEWNVVKSVWECISKRRKQAGFFFSLCHNCQKRRCEEQFYLQFASFFVLLLLTLQLGLSDIKMLVKMPIQPENTSKESHIVFYDL